MKIKLRLSLLVVVVVAVMVTGIVSILLRKVSYISLDLNMRNVEFLAGQRAEFWKGMENGYIRTLHTLADVMGGYEAFPKESRRDRYDEILKSALESERGMVGLYTVWKPDAFDGMDSRYIGRVGSGPAGQYATAYTRETGKITAGTSGDIEKLTAYISGPNARRDRVENPSPGTVNGKETLTYLISVPVISRKTGDVVGGVGCVLSVDVIQSQIENSIGTNDIVDMVALYSGNGTVLAHFIPERVGKKMFDVDVELGDSMTAVFEAIQNGTSFRDTKYDPALGENIGFVMKPFQIGNSDHNMAVLVGASESYIFREIRDITKFTVILAVLALALSAIIVYFAMNKITGPIVTAAAALKGICEGEGDLSKKIEERGDDEIADLVRYFNKTLDRIRGLVAVIKKGRTVTSSGIGAKPVRAPVKTPPMAAPAAAPLAADERDTTGRQIKESFDRINEIIRKNREDLDVIMREVSRFKTA